MREKQIVYCGLCARYVCTDNIARKGWCTAKLTMVRELQQHMSGYKGCRPLNPCIGTPLPDERALLRKGIKDRLERERRNIARRVYRARIRNGEEPKPHVPGNGRYYPFTLAEKERVFELRTEGYGYGAIGSKLKKEFGQKRCSNYLRKMCREAGLR